MKTITRVYDTHSHARRAVAALEAGGVPSPEISLIANKYVREKHADVTDVSKTAAGAGIGGTLGAGAGLLAGVGLLAIPGLGPVVAAGWLASLAVGAAAGAATGGLVGALVSAGTSDAHAHVYSEAVRRGGTLVSVRVPDGDAGKAEGILDSYQPVDPAERGAAYRQEGWKNFDPKAPAYRPTEADIERMRRESDLAA